MRRIHDRSVRLSPDSATFFRHMQLAGTMTVLAADREFEKRRAPKKSIPICDGLWTACVTRDTGIEDRPVEALIDRLETWRKRPFTFFRVVRKRRLEEIIAALDSKALAVLSRPDHEAELVRV